MNGIKTILVTGSNGYIGSLLTPLLEKEGFKVIGLDATYFDDPECYFKPRTENPAKGEARQRRQEPSGKNQFKFIKKDVRYISHEDLKGIDAVCHLAALSNDPMGEINPELTFEINLRASEKLANLAKTAGVKKFLFSSSCSVYGAIGDGQEITEETPTDPKTAYAISKVEFEKSLLKLADNNFCPVILRNATAYGSSPKFRADLVMNNFAANAFDTGEIKIMSDGTPWRPIIHAEDIARIFVALLKTPDEKVRGQIINCGQNKENFQVRDIALAVQAALPKIKITFASKPDKDSRTYKVNFDKLKKLLPDFQFKWNLKKAAADLCADFKTYGLPQNVLKQKHFIRLKQIQHLLKTKRVNPDLFWK